MTATTLIVCCDGLKGLPDAVRVVWPRATVQTCVVHLIRNSLKHVSYKDRKAIVKDLRPIYQAATGAQRRDVHRALAEALSGHGDPDREAWHRASAAAGAPAEVPGPHESIMAGLNCGNVSVIAWPAVHAGVDLFVAVPEDRKSVV